MSHIFVQDVFKIDRRGNVFTGSVVGSFYSGQQIFLVSPDRVCATLIRAIERSRRLVDSCDSGDEVGILTSIDDPYYRTMSYCTNPVGVGGIQYRPLFITDQESHVGDLQDLLFRKYLTPDQARTYSGRTEAPRAFPASPREVPPDLPALVEAAIDRYLHILVRKRSELVYLDDYEDIIDVGWDREVDRFIAMKLGQFAGLEAAVKPIVKNLVERTSQARG